MATKTSASIRKRVRLICAFQRRLREVEILETTLPEGTYRSLGNVEATVKKLIAFHKNPTKKQANIALAEEAKKVGVDAVIDTTYKSGVGFITWGYIKASGEAVKKDLNSE